MVSASTRARRLNVAKVARLNVNIFMIVNILYFPYFHGGNVQLFTNGMI